jgi:hypothetical protein
MQTDLVVVASPNPSMDEVTALDEPNAVGTEEYLHKRVLAVSA